MLNSVKTRTPILAILGPIQPGDMALLLLSERNKICTMRDPE